MNKEIKKLVKRNKKLIKEVFENDSKILQEMLKQDYFKVVSNERKEWYEGRIGRAYEVEDCFKINGDFIVENEYDQQFLLSDVEFITKEEYDSLEYSNVVDLILERRKRERRAA